MEVWAKYAFGKGNAEMCTKVQLSFANLSEILKWHYAKGLIKQVDFEQDIVVYNFISILNNP